ncbi:MAG: ABC transporter ATP-binding protein [Tissierellia bacterium]|nr:ABC transporter ATP-binding protein [Tissierellia bacterium]
MDDFIVLKDVKKIYRMGEERVYALNGVSLNIKKEEFVCLLGPSGSGKSTLLNMMAGLEKPTKGEIWIGGKPIHKMNEESVTKFRQLNVGFVFQSYNLIPTLTAAENVSLGLIFRGVPKKKRDQMAKKILTEVGLGDRLNHKPHEMSGGQQQRVSIARAFVDKPKIVFADEPTGNLDTKTTKEIMDMITSMAKEFKQTLIIVTHNVELAVYANKIIHLLDGKVENIEINENLEILEEK